MDSNKQYIYINALEDKLHEHICYVVFAGGIEQTINHWLRPILDIADANKEFVRPVWAECRGWYVNKEHILNVLHSTVPNDMSVEHQNKISDVLNDIWDFVLDYGNE